MDADEIARRIRHIHDIETSMDESGEGRAPLTDAHRNAIPYMTPEEIRETLFRTLDKLYGDRDTKERKLAEKERAIAESNARIAALEKELATINLNA